MTDYPLVDYSDIKEELDRLEVSENDYISIRKRIFADTDNITGEYMSSIADISKVKSGSLIYAAKRVYGSVVEKEFGIFTVFYAIEFLLFIWCMCLNINKYEKLKILLACVGGFIILAYFQYIGRAPDRIYISVLFSINFVELTVLHKGVKTIAAFDAVMDKLYIAAAGGVLAAVVYYGNYTLPQNPFSADRNADITKYQDVLDDDNIYVWRVYARKKCISEYFMKQGKLIPEDILNYNISDGGWMYGQGYFKEYLEDTGIENPLKAILYDEKVFYISDSDSCGLILTYLREHYDEAVQVVQTGEIDGVPIWEFSVL